jgi:pSer/pThr/pTyr-binding forkhead associated (FHA) protein
MSVVVSLTVVEGGRELRNLKFRDRTVAVIGRAAGCSVQLPSDLAHMTVSRQHCLLDIDPPEIRVQDVGSRNGTFINGVKIGQRSPRIGPDDTPNEEAAVYALKDGDELGVGDTVFRVKIGKQRQEPEAAPFFLSFFGLGKRNLCGSSVQDN